MLKDKTVLGVFWSFSEQMTRRGISVLVTLFLAYFLTPEDYGLVAMITLFLTLGNVLMESGFKQALIRKKEISELDLNTAFYSNISLAFLSCFLLFFIAPFASEYYNEPRLTLLIRVSSILLLFNSFQTVQAALLSKKIQFKKLLKANIPATGISSIFSILLAYYDYGAWALIWQMLIFSILSSFFLWLQSDWRPSLIFSLKSLRDMYQYGYKLFLSSVLEVIYKNIFVIVIAKYFSVSLAGLFFFADRIKDLLVTQLITSIQTVTFSSLSIIQDDSERLKNAYRKIMKVMTFSIFPILIVFSALSELIFQIFLPEKWLPSVPFLQIMCLSCLIIPITSINLNVIKVKGRTDWYLYLEIIKKSTAFLILFFTIEYGVIAILLGQAFSQIINYFPSVYFSSKLVNYNISQQLGDFIPNLILSMIVGCIVLVGQNLIYYPPIVELLLLSFASIFIFFSLALLFRMTSFYLFLGLIKGLVNKK
ncbi:lipopolysaccharide biosynthesis protein [Vibrio cincinnatiensis]|uniref:lipopolysaccharide biosynthesis protein n=1 Tax=Vibrio cincinnatiensis TaxID=675 RepID=UPI001FAB2682|nr:lipopolysaccharide biosynthesis protein [Vibrio cincinnatiensis]